MPSKKSAPDPVSLSSVIAEADAAATQEELLASQERLKALLREGFGPTEKAERPYGAALEMTESFRKAYVEVPATGAVEGAFGDTIGGMAIDAANALARAERRVGYRLKTLFGFQGIRLVEEGDSWTQYPILLEDIADQLNENSDIAIYSVGAAGDLASNIAAQKEYLKALSKTGAEGLLISCGGNDFFGEFEKVLLDYSRGIPPEALINEAIFRPVFTDVVASYQTILTDVARDHPGVPVFGHGYDLPFPEEKGNWIGPALIAKGIPFDVGRGILKVIMDRFNGALIDLARSNSNFIVSDLRDKVGKGPNSWFDELHPKNAGYGRASAILESTIRDTLAARRAESLRAENAEFFGNLKSKALPAKQTIVLDPGHGGTANVGGSSWNNAVGPNGTLEKALTLDIAMRTRDFLEDRGFSVLLTREADVNLSLAARAAVAKNARAEVFLSIHFNGFDGRVQGTETFIDRNANGASGTLSLHVQNEMLAALNHRDRNFGAVKFPDEQLGVLKPANHDDGTAVALHEVSFMDVAEEEARLAKVSYRRKIATALADGIEAFMTESYLGGGAEVASEGFGDAFELAAARVGSSDGELLRATSTPDFAMELVNPTSSGALVTGGEVPGSISNGHMLAGNLGWEDDAALWALAQHEARRAGIGVERSALGEPEGNEPDEFDPNVERVLGSMSANVEFNFGLLKQLFRAGPATANTPTHAHVALPQPAGFAAAGGFDMDNFIAFIESLNLVHFSPSEFLALGGGHHGTGDGAGLNTYPPRNLWENIANTAKMLDEIRKRLGVGIIINSAYRSPAYNLAIGGATRSQHQRFNALDWTARSGTPDQWHAVAQAVESANPAIYGGWSKAYTARNFVHIDTRAATVSLA